MSSVQLKTCPVCGRQTQPRNTRRSREHLIPGVPIAMLANGTCERDWQRTRKPAKKSAPAISEIRIENTRAGLESFLARRRRRRVPAQGWMVDAS